MDEFEQGATVSRSGLYATITVGVTAPGTNKVGRVGYPHVSQALATASAPAQTTPHGGMRG